MGREEDLRALFAESDAPSRLMVDRLLADVAFMEKRLEELRKLPMIEVHPEHAARQRPTQAAKQYRDTLQQYNSCLKTLIAAAGKTSGKEVSPLRSYLESLKESFNP